MNISDKLVEIGSFDSIVSIRHISTFNSIIDFKNTYHKSNCWIFAIKRELRKMGRVGINEQLSKLFEI